MHLKVNMSFVYLFVELVLFDNPGGGEGNHNSHMIISVEGSGKVKKFDAKAHVFGFWGDQYTVPMQFGRCYVGRSHCELGRVIDEVSPAVIQIRFRYSFCGRWSRTTRAYVTVGSFGMLGMSLGSMTNIAFIPFWCRPDTYHQSPCQMLSSRSRQ